MTVRRSNDCYTIEFSKLYMYIAILSAFMLVVTPIVGAIATYTKVLVRLDSFLTREEAAAIYLTRSAADSIVSQRNEQIEALNTNIVAIASNQDVLNGNLNRIMGRLGIDGSQPMRPIPHATLPLARNPEPARKELRG